MKTTTSKAKKPARAAVAPFAPGALVIVKGSSRPALSFSYMSKSGTVYAKGSTYPEESAETIHDLGDDLSRIVEVPKTITLADGSKLRTRDLAQIAALVKKAERHFKASAKVWVDRNNGGGMDEINDAKLEHRERDQAEKGAALLAPLGIECEWPGLYPSFKVNGYAEHTTATAVCSALGLYRNALTPSRS
jgi:hypothetical protein